MVKNLLSKLLIALVALSLFQNDIYSQTGGIPTGSDTACLGGISLYKRTYGGNRDEFTYGSAPSADSGFVVVGQTNSFGSGGTDGLVMKVNKRGTVVWTRAVGGANNDVLFQVRRTSDNGFIACGQTRSYGNAAGDAWLVKLDASGSVQWSKKYGDGNVNGEISYDVIQLSDGGYAFCGVHRFAGGVAESFVVRTNSQGDVTWSRQYGNGVSDDAAGIAEDGASLVVVGFYQASSFYDGYIMKLDKATGSVQWIRGYDAEGRSTWFNKVEKTSSGYQVFSVITDNFVDQNQQTCIWNLNTDGTLQNVRKLSVPGNWSISTGWYSQGDGGFVAAAGENNPGSDAIVCQVNAGGSLIWSRKIIQTGRQHMTAIQRYAEGGYAIAGNNNNAGTSVDSSDVFILRVDSTGTAGSCSGINTGDLSVITPSVVATTPDVTALGNVNILNPVITVGVASPVPSTNTLCFYCQPKPTGTERPVSAGLDGDRMHGIKAYPNPVINGSVNLQVNALYNDMAVVTIVDVNGNILYALAPRVIREGQNLIGIEIPLRMQRYTNYFINVQFRNYNSAVKIFVIR